MTKMGAQELKLLISKRLYEADVVFEASIDGESNAVQIRRGYLFGFCFISKKVFYGYVLKAGEYHRLEQEGFLDEDFVKSKGYKGDNYIMDNFEVWMEVDSTEEFINYFALKKFKSAVNKK